MESLIKKYIQPIWYKTRYTQVQCIMKELMPNTRITKEMFILPILPYSQIDDTKMLTYDVNNIIHMVLPFEERGLVFEKAKNIISTHRLMWIDEFINSTELKVHQDFNAHCNSYFHKDIMAFFERQTMTIGRHTPIEKRMRYVFEWSRTPEGFKIWHIINVCYLLGVPVKTTNDIYCKLIQTLK